MSLLYFLKKKFERTFFKGISKKVPSGLDNIISSRAGYVQTICQERKFPELSFTFCLLLYQGGKSSSTSFRVSGWLSSPFRTRKINDVSSSSTSVAAAAASSSLSSSSAASCSASPPLEEVEQELAELEAEQRRILGLASSCWPGSGGGRGSGSSPADSPLTELPSAEEQQLLQEQQEPGALQQLMAQEELLKLYILKLEEEANYFKATSPVEEEFCACPKCQVNWTGLASCVWNGFRTPKRPSELMSEREGEGKSWRLGQSERSRDGCRQRRVREEGPLLRDIGRLERRSWWALPTLKNIPLGEKKKVYGGSERPIRISWKGSEEGKRRYEGGGAGEGGRRLLSWVVGGCGWGEGELHKVILRLRPLLRRRRSGRKGRAIFLPSGTPFLFSSSSLSSLSCTAATAVSVDPRTYCLTSVAAAGTIFRPSPIFSPSRSPLLSDPTVSSFPKCTFYRENPFDFPAPQRHTKRGQVATGLPAKKKSS